MFYRIIFFAILVGLTGIFTGCSERNSLDKSEDTRAEANLDLLPDSVYFWQHIAPVIFENCTPCHHSDGAGPFPLTEYIDSKKRTKTIRAVIADGVMPPWPADTNYRRFKDEKIIESLEKNLILKWIDQGAPEGNIPAVKPIPQIFASKGLGEPDLVLEFPDTVFISGDNRDKFRLAKIPFELPNDTVVRAISFIPGNRRLVHHVNGHLVNYPEGKKKDVFAGDWIKDAEEVNSLTAYREMKIPNDDGTYPPLLVSAFNYLPGVEPPVYPEGMGTMVVNKKGAFILNTLHYGPSAIDTFDLSRIEVYFAEKRPERPFQELQMGTLGITPVVPEFIIEANKVSKFSTRYKVPTDMSVFTINPHMHLLGTEFTAYALSANKQDTIPLIHIPKWDFRWQYFYTFQHILKIPKGYEIVVEAVFDNTIHNPHNPFMPPKTIRESGRHMKTTDEMFQFFITYVPYKEGDELIKL